MKVGPATEMVTRWFSWMHVNFYRTWGGSGPFNRNVLVLTTRGRKTGRTIPKPLIYYENEGRLYLVASYGGNDNHPAWYLNLVANPEVTVERGNERRTYRARTLSEAEAKGVWPGLIRIYPTYADYQKRTSRVIPLVELTPA